MATIRWEMGKTMKPNLTANSDPMAKYLIYLADVQRGAVGNMGFTLEDFQQYIARLRNMRRVR